MVRLHFTYNKDKMAEWLDGMDRQGWALRSVTAGFCSFEPVTPGTYDYQVDYAGAGGLAPGYAALMHELGIDIICRWGPWVFLRRAAADGPFELYTDADSRLEQLSRVKRFFKIMAVIELACVMWLLSLSLLEHSWVWLIFCGLGLAAAAGMIMRVRQIRVEMASLGAAGYALTDDRTALMLIGIGCLTMAIGLLLPESGAQYWPEFLKGAGIGLELLGLLRYVWSRNQA